MQRITLRGLAAAGVLLIGSCSSPGDGTHAIGPAGEYRRLRYPDGQVSANQACGIRLSNPLNPRVRPLYVNGMPVGFC